MIKIHNEDCLITMSKMKDQEIDLIFTSPPFKNEDVEGDYWTIYEKWIQEMLRVSKVTCIIHSATKMNQHISKYPPKRTLIWGKGLVAYTWRYNPIYVYENNSYKVNKYIWSDAFGVPPIKGSNKVHKYQDPDILYETVIKMISRGGLMSVYDPFMGSGTTMRACINLGMEFIGSEIDSSYTKE